MKFKEFWFFTTICMFIVNANIHNIASRILLGTSAVMLICSIIKTIIDWRKDNG